MLTSLQYIQLNDYEYVEVVLQLMIVGTVDVLKLLALVSCVWCVDVIVVLEDGVVDVAVIEYVTVVSIIEGDSGNRVVLVLEAKLDWV